MDDVIWSMPTSASCDLTVISAKLAVKILPNLAKEEENYFSSTPELGHFLPYLCTMSAGSGDCISSSIFC